MNAATEAPDTPRRHLLVLAHRALRFGHMSVEDEVAMASVLDRAAAVRAFEELCDHLVAGNRNAAESVLDLLTGGLR